MDTHARMNYIRLADGKKEVLEVELALEATVGLNVNAEGWLDFQCTPIDLDALAVGFLYNEGFLNSLDDIANIHVCNPKDHISNGQVDIWLHRSVHKPNSWSRTSGCQGGYSHILQTTPTRQNMEAGNITIDTITRQVDIFMGELSRQNRNPGLHTSMLVENDEIVHSVKDIGRHNTLDKLIGFCLLQKMHLVTPTLISTGRISLEMVLKAARMGIPLLISLHSTSRQAVQAAGEVGITLISHAGRGHLQILTHAEQITGI